MRKGRNIIISQDISPFNIALLILIQLCASDVLPIKRRILLFLIQQIEGERITVNKKINVTPSLSDIITELQEFQEGDQNLKTNQRREHTIDAVILLFLDLAWGLESEERMHRQINNAYILLLDPNQILGDGRSLISPRSILGRFVQKIVVASKLLNFDESHLLFHTFCLFRKSSWALYDKLRKENPEFVDQVSSIVRPPSQSLVRTTMSNPRVAIHSMFLQDENSRDDQLIRSLQAQLDESLSMTYTQNEESLISPVTKSNIESLVEAQVEFFERSGTPTPPALRSIMEQMASPYFEFPNMEKTQSYLHPSYHYLRYLENLFEGHYLGAFDSLHQYFDYMVSRGSRNFYHFALIARASLHQYFGEDQKALDSIEEAVSVARENKDNATLTYVLSWLSNFMQDKPDLWVNQITFQNNSDAQLLNFLTRKSECVSLTLAAVSCCFVTRTMMLKGDVSGKVYESLFQALYVCVNDGPTSFVKCCGLASLVWSRLGNSFLSDLYTDIGLEYASEFGSKSDLLSLMLRQQAEIQIRDDPGEAIQALQGVQQKFDGNISHRLKLQAQILQAQIDTDLRKGKCQIAYDNMEILKSSCDIDDESRSVLVKMETNMLALNDDFSGAIRKVNLAISDSRANSHQSFPYSISMNLLKTHLLIESNESRRALSLLLQQIKLAKWVGYGTILIEALVQLACLLNLTDFVLESYQVALRLVPSAIRTHNKLLIAKLYFELARSCCIFLERGSSELSDKELFTNFLKFLSLSIAGFKKTGSLTMLIECFRLEQRVASAGSCPNNEASDSAPFQNFKRHSKAGLEILQRRAAEECNREFLKT